MHIPIKKSQTSHKSSLLVSIVCQQFCLLTFIKCNMSPPQVFLHVSIHKGKAVTENGHIMNLMSSINRFIIYLKGIKSTCKYSLGSVFQRKQIASLVKADWKFACFQFHGQTTVIKWNGYHGILTQWRNRIACHMMQGSHKLGSFMWVSGWVWYLWQSRYFDYDAGL